MRRAIPRCSSLLLVVSIHAPTRGATQNFFKRLRKKFGFNSRTHAGCDAASAQRVLSLFRFNSRTHAGCDRISITIKPSELCFNSRTHAGCDTEGRIFSGLRGLFQFTHPRGVRHLETVRRNNRLTVSIHAPTRGATGILPGWRQRSRFQFTHPRGVRLTWEFNMILYKR